jgi:hypothetical protein
VDVNIEAGEAGLEEDHPIVLDDDDEQAGPSRLGRQGSVKVEPTGSARPAGNTVSTIVDEIAEAQVSSLSTLPSASRYSSSTSPLENSRTTQRAQTGSGSWARGQQGEHHSAG